MKYYCFSDIHGHKALFKKILKFLQKQSEPWKCVFLGDAADRKEDGYEIIKYLLNDKEHFIYLKGNHEDMLVLAAKAFYKHFAEDRYTLKAHYGESEAEELALLYSYDWDISLYLQNGGLSTFKDWIRDGAPMRVINALDKLPTSYEYINKSGKSIYCCHAGHLLNKSDSPIWSREHFQEAWPRGLMIHGHTPVRSLMKLGISINPAATNHPAFYQENTKVDIDTGCFCSDTINLMDLDTLESKVFTTLI